MRHQYTPIFRDVLTSRVWAQPHATVRVWLWLQVSADPEGNVSASLSGVAVGARVTLEEARDALDMLVSVDPDASPEDEFEGRFIERVARGWRILNFETDRERAKHESHKARNRRYMQRVRAEAKLATQRPPEPANDAPVDANTGDVDVPKPIPKPKPFPSEGESPQPPDAALGFRYQARDDGAVVVSRPVVVHRIPEDWQPSEETRHAARIAGVVDFDSRLKALRSGPIGGTRGVFLDELDEYVRGFIGKWRTWDETDRAKAVAAAARPAGGRSFQPPPWEPNGKHRAYAQKRGLNLPVLVEAFTKRNYTRENYSEKELNEKFGQFLSVAAKGVAA